MGVPLNPQGAVLGPQWGSLLTLNEPPLVPERASLSALNGRPFRLSMVFPFRSQWASLSALNGRPFRPSMGLPFGSQWASLSALNGRPFQHAMCLPFGSQWASLWALWALALCPPLGTLFVMLTARQKGRPLLIFF